MLAGTTKALSGREVARLSGVSVNDAWKALKRLAEHGVVNEEPAGGRTTLYTLNRDHVAAEAIITVTRLRSMLVSRIKEQLATWEIQPVHASLFGSAARGDGDTTSDVDLFIVRPKGVDEEDTQWRSQLNELASVIRAGTGNHAGISEIPERELPRLRRERPQVVQDVERDGITLFGEPASTLLRRRR